jgi:hypothetical protein
VQPGLAAAASPGIVDGLRLEVAASRVGVLHVSEQVGTVLSLGRYHRLPPLRDVVLQRRHSGGRVAPAGAGFVGVTVVLPHRAALVAADPAALAPEQVINRCVRGVLAGLELLGVRAFYPGRDAVTCDGRTIALAAFEVDAAGTLVFEAIVAVGRDFSVLPALLDAADPEGVVPARLVTANDATSVARETGRAPTIAEVAECVRRGYETRMGVRVVDRSRAIPEGALDAGWLAQRVPRPDLERRATTSGQLGVLEVHCARDGDRLREVALSGDFIANSPAVVRVERALAGCAADAAAIGAVVERELAPPENFLLGLGPLTVLTGTIARAAGA